MQESLYQAADAGDNLLDSGCRIPSIRQRMQETHYQTADAEVSISDSVCRSHFIRQQLQETIYHQTADSIRQGMQETLYQRFACRRDSLSDSSGCRSLSIRQLQEALYQTAGAEDFPFDSGCTSISQTADQTDSGRRRLSSGCGGSDSGCRRHSLRLDSGCRSFNQTADLYQTAGKRLSIRQGRRLSIRQRTQDLYQTAVQTADDNGCRSIPADAEDSLSDSGCRRHFIRQRMQKSLYQEGRVSIRKRMLYQTADEGDSLLDS